MERTDIIREQFVPITRLLPDVAALHRATTLRTQLRLEEGHYGRVEFAVEDGAIESRGVAAGLGSNPFERRRARCDERKVTGVRHHAVFGLHWKPLIHILGMTRM